MLVLHDLLTAGLGTGASHFRRPFCTTRHSVSPLAFFLHRTSPVNLAQIVPAEEIWLNLEDRGAALLRVPAVHVAARVWRAMKLGDEDRRGQHAHRRFFAALGLSVEASREWSRTLLWGQLAPEVHHDALA